MCVSVQNVGCGILAKVYYGASRVKVYYAHYRSEHLNMKYILHIELQCTISILYMMLYWENSVHLRILCALRYIMCVIVCRVCCGASWVHGCCNTPCELCYIILQLTQYTPMRIIYCNSRNILRCA